LGKGNIKTENQLMNIIAIVSDFCLGDQWMIIYLVNSLYDLFCKLSTHFKTEN